MSDADLLAEETDRDEEADREETEAEETAEETAAAAAPAPEAAAEAEPEAEPDETSWAATAAMKVRARVENCMILCCKGASGCVET